jgi:SAM-dependent methyltransferase
MRPRRIPLVVALAGAIALGGPAWAQTPATETDKYTPTVGQFGKDVVWVPTPQILVDRMLDMAKLQPGDRLVDLGSGDGRTVITAAKRGVAARGIEFNPDMVVLAQRAAAAEGVSDRASFEQGDIFEADFSDATVVTLFLLPTLNVRLRPTLLDMPPGTRILSNSFTMGDWQPDETVYVGEACVTWCSAFKWVVPAKVAGTWKIGDGQLVLTQNFQMLQGSLRSGDSSVPITEARLDGARIEFSVGKQRYVGQVTADAMHGTIDGAKTWTATR